jgi:S-adenosylhomocysteine hydrolase
VRARKKANIGHFGNEIEVAALRQYGRDNIKPQVDHITDVQARYIGVSKQGPYKGDQYRY